MTSELSLASPWFYRAKAVHTRLRALGANLGSGTVSGGNGVRILFYHRIADDADELAVSPQRFERQMEYLAAKGYEALDVAGVWEKIVSGQASSRLVGLCFDDGYLDVADNGLPLLARHGFRATVFVATGVTSGTVAFSWYAKQPPLMAWDQIAELDAAGVLRFEPHTVTHPNLLRLGDADARVEIVESKRVIEERLGRGARVFCYPAGLFGERERSYVEQAGFELAVSCEPGVNVLETDPFALRRIQVDARDGLAVFKAKVGGRFDTPSRLRASYRRRRHAGGS